MKQGSLQERFLENSVIRILEQNSATAKDSCVGVGCDYAVSGEYVTAQGWGNTPACAWYKAMNNFVCSGGSCRGAVLNLMLPASCKDGWLKKTMTRFALLAKSEGIPILSGHTQVWEGYGRPSFLVVMTGTRGNFAADRRRVQPGDEIVMAGYTAVLGTNLLLNREEENADIAAGLRERFTEAFLEEASYAVKDYSIRAAAEFLTGAGKPQKRRDEFLTGELEIQGEALRERVKYLHDASCGGIYSALWQLGKWSGYGIQIDNKRIPVRQHTIEICEYLNRNPYLTDATGALLCICDKGRDICEHLRQLGMVAEVIGQITQQPHRQVILGPEDIRTLAPAEGDEIFH